MAKLIDKTNKVKKEMKREVNMKVNFLKKRLITAGTTFAALLVAGASVGMAISLCLITIKVVVKLWF